MLYLYSVVASLKVKAYYALGEILPESGFDTRLFNRVENKYVEFDILERVPYLEFFQDDMYSLHVSYSSFTSPPDPTIVDALKHSPYLMKFAEHKTAFEGY